MGARLEELGQRLSPDHLKRQAREAIVEKVEDTRSRAVRLARRRPVPLAASVIGAAGLMLLRSRRGGAAASRGPAHATRSPSRSWRASSGRARGHGADGHARGSSGSGRPEPMRLKELLPILGDTRRDFLADDCPTQAAALSYYTIFSLPPLLAVVLLIVGSVLDPGDVQDASSSRSAP